MVVACLHFAQKLRTEEITNMLNAFQVVNIHIFGYQQEPTYLLTPWSRVLLEKLTGSAASQEISALYGTRSFITAFTSACTYPYPEHQQEPTNKFAKR
jgi:hypothetical protein